MPTLCANPASDPPTPAPGAQGLQPPDDLTPNNHESATAGTPRLVTEGPAAVVVATPPNPPVPTPDTAVTPGETSITPGEEDVCVEVEKPPKGKRFHPSRAKNARYASKYFLFHCHSLCSGVSLSANGPV